jgi:tRNA(fMet)-specific endonuclease VapC
MTASGLGYTLPLGSATQAAGPLATLIAAHALSLNATLVTNNTREFERVPGLRIEDWTAS